MLVLYAEVVGLSRFYTKVIIATFRWPLICSEKLIHFIDVFYLYMYTRFL